MDIRVVDTSAVMGASPAHRAAPAAKLVAFGFVLASVVLSTNVLVVAGVALALAAAVPAWRLPGRAVYSLAAYPALFALVFAFAAAPDPLTGSLFVAKALAAALAALLLIFTTPYPQVFAPLQAVVPSVVGDAMLMTYRSLFLLADKFGHLMTAIKLRSGLAKGHPVRAARATASALGGLLLYSIDLSQREYDVLRVRGYGRRLRVQLPPGRSAIASRWLVAGGVAVFGVSLAVRLAFVALNPYSWTVPLVTLALLVGVALYRWRRP
jgi:energy-coupling factor transporter transmembrane protein EcfT